MNTKPQTPAGRAPAGNPETAGAAAADMRDEAGALGRDIADAARDSVADDMSAISGALRRASNELRDGSPRERTFGAAADAMADLADSLRDRDLGQIADELGDFARRNPVGFLGGAALLGFAGARMAKASRRARLGDGDDNPARSRATAHARPVTASGTNRGDGPTPDITRTGETP